MWGEGRILVEIQGVPSVWWGPRLGWLLSYPFNYLTDRLTLPSLLIEHPVCTMNDMHHDSWSQVGSSTRQADNISHQEVPRKHATKPCDWPKGSHCILLITSDISLGNFYLCRRPTFPLCSSDPPPCALPPRCCLGLPTGLTQSVPPAVDLPRRDHFSLSLSLSQFCSEQGGLIRGQNWQSPFLPEFVLWWAQ